jgi:hypothetical protein
LGTSSPPQLTGINDLLNPHNERWSILPIIVYRVL